MVASSGLHDAAPPASVKPVLKRVFVAEYPSKDCERISSFLKSQRGRGYALVINLATGPSCLSQEGVSCVDAPCASHVDVGTLLETCSMAANCLSEHQENVVLVHSLHSISKPAAFAIAFLMWTSFCSSIDEALIFTCEKLGVPTAILAPSQIRHLEYFYHGNRLRLYKVGIPLELHAVWRLETWRPHLVCSRCTRCTVKLAYRLQSA